METLYIIEKNMKNELLKRNENTLENKKYMTFKELKENLYFKYNEETIYEVMKQENTTYEIANIYLNNLYFLEESSPKIDKLKKIYNYLNEKQLLKYNPLFKNYLKNTKIKIYNPHLSKEEKQLLKGLDYEIETLKKRKTQIKLIPSITLENEVEVLAINITNLIKQGINPKNIKIINLNDEYKMCIEKIFTWYNIPNNINIEKKLSSTHISKEFLKSNNIEEGLNKIKDLIKTPLDEEIYNKLLEISSKYVTLPQDEITKNMIKEEVKNTNLKTNKIKNGVEEGDIYTIYDTNTFIFIIGFNEGILPKIYKDEDYLSDKEKQMLNINTSIENNTLEKEKLEFFLNHNNNITLSYKTKTISEVYYPSSYLEEIKCTIEKITNDYTHSNTSNKMTLGIMLDNMYKYNIIDENLQTLMSNYPTIPYNTYKNTFTGLSKNIEENITLSYTSLDNYNRCAFRYYLQYILKINKYERTFMTFIGELFHYILSKSFLENFDFNLEWNKFILENKETSTNKEKFFLNKLKKEILFIIDEIKKQNSYSEFNECMYEEKINIPLTDKISFVGIIDKIMYKQDEKLLALVDYKTGSKELKLKYLPYGIDMQLPIYLYLIKKHDKMKNYQVVGFYLQKLISNTIKSDDKKTYEKQNNLKLDGYSIGDIEKLEKFDKTYENSEVIKNMKISSNGFYHYSKVLNNEEMENLFNVVEENITKCVTNITNKEFQINPKQTYDENVGCAYCTFQDICYKTANDYVQIKETKLEEVIGSETNA